MSGVISFENPNFRRIKSVSIRARTDLDERFSLDIWADRWFVSAEIQVESKLDEQALYISREVSNRLVEMKPWYDLLARNALSKVVIVLWFVWTMVYTAGQVLGIVPPASSLARLSFPEVMNIAVLFALIVLALLYPFDWAQKRLFPKVFFLIGKQKNTMETIKRWRGFVFGGVILAIVTGVIGNIISNRLIK